MRLDLSSTFDFGDAVGLRCFLLDHGFAHIQTSQALTAKYGGTYTTFGVQRAAAAEDNWVEMMATRRGPPDQAMIDWLALHAYIHQETYQTIGGNGTVAPDLSVVDFSSPIQFYDWMYAHQQMHDYEQGALGITS